MKTPCLLSSMIALAALSLPACKTPTKYFCEVDADCAEWPDRPFCDVEGTYPASEGVGRTCIPNPTADAGVEPDGGGEGDFCDPDDCPLGCDETNTRCLAMAPSNGLAPYLDTAAGQAALDLPAGITIDTDQGAAIDADGNVIELASELVPAPEGGVPVRVVWASEVTLRDAEVIGSPALAIVASGPIRVLGTVSLTPTDPDLPVPGMAVCAPDTIECMGGSAGGSFGSFGGEGGDTDADPGGDPLPTGGNEALVPLRGGCRGGSNYEVRNGDIYRSFGGQGGGALQLSSASNILIGVGATTGLLIANGGGGIDNAGPYGSGLYGCGGGGGGSGGGILIEAPTVALAATSRVSTVGGGGSSWRENGETAFGSAPFAEGGPNTGTAGSGDGGRGAYASNPAQAGGTGTMIDDTTPSGGGGGGGGGRIRINTSSGQFDSDGTVSPPPSVGALTTR